MVYRDLAADPIEHLSGHVLAARFGAEIARTPAQTADLAAGDRAIEDFLAADVVVIGAPMYTFAIPSQLKAWIDRIAVAGKTFRYSATGVEGLAGGKKVIVVSARGADLFPGRPHGRLRLPGSLSPPGCSASWATTSSSRPRRASPRPQPQGEGRGLGEAEIDARRLAAAA